MLKDLIQRKKGLDQAILIEKKDKSYIIKVNKEIEINDFIDFLYKKKKYFIKFIKFKFINRQRKIYY